MLHAEGRQNLIPGNKVAGLGIQQRGGAPVIRPARIHPAHSQCYSSSEECASSPHSVCGLPSSGVVLQKDMHERKRYMKREIEMEISI